MEEKSTIRKALEPVLPPILFRNHPMFKAWTGLSPRSVANLDAKKRGPGRRVYSGRVCGYEKSALLTWLEQRSREVAA